MADLRIFSLPYRFVGKHVWVRVDPESVQLSPQGHLPEERAEYGNRCRPHWEERAAAIGWFPGP